MSFLFAVLLGIGQPGDGGTPTAQELEAGILKNRESLRFGTLQIKSECYSFVGSGKKLDEQARRDIWFDEKRIRVSWVGKDNLPQEGDNVRHICVPFLSPNESLEYNDRLPKHLQLVIKWQIKNDDYHLMLIDPKALGLCTLPMHRYCYYKLGMLSRTDFKGTVRPTLWEEKTAYEIIYEGLTEVFKKTKTKLRLLVVPGLGYSVPEVEASAIHNGKVNQELLRIDNKQFGKSRRWFPHKLNFQMVWAGNLVEEDKTEIVSADFDTPPAESVFRLPAMNIPAGTPVIINFDGKRREWNGKEIIEKPPDPKVAMTQYPDLPPATRTSWSSPWLLTAAGLSLAAGVSLCWAWRRRKTGV